VLVSRSAHFARLNSTDWAGLGMDNIREIDVDEKNEMSRPAPVRSSHAASSL
jgi:hypothetical protein